MPYSTRSRVCLAAAAAGVLVIVSSVGAYLYIDAGGMKASAKATPQVTLSNKVARQAYDWGLRTCIGPVNRISDFLTKGKHYSALSLRGTRDPDKQMFSAAVAADDAASKSGSFSVMAVSPTPGGECDSIYQTVTYFEVSCESAKSAYFSDFSEPIAFGDKVKAFGTKNGGAFAYFLSVPPSACVAVKMQAFL